MEIEEMNQRIREINSKAEIECNKVRKEFAEANNPFKVGDIVEDHIGKLKIEEVKYSFMWGVPTCRFLGVELKKDETPMKRQTGRIVSQNNINKQP